MESKAYITSYCCIESNRLTLNGEVIFEFPGLAFPDFAKQAYQQLGIAYPKFFKMDNLSKLTFLAADLLLGQEVSGEAENNTALLFANRSSSLDTDVKFNEQIAGKDNYYPSPAVFVYTLPNICMGEISIRHKLYTENSFFIFADFNPDFFAGYTSILLNTGKADKVLCGWVEFYKESYKAFLYVVSGNGTIEHTASNIRLLFEDKWKH